MKLVIDIDKESYEEIKKIVADGNDMFFTDKLIANGKPLEQEPKIRYCKDCKWWKDSNGAFRRGIGAESICRINTDIVYQGDGYCYLFEPQESEDKE